MADPRGFDRRQFLATCGRAALGAAALGATGLTAGCGAGRLGVGARPPTASHAGYLASDLVDKFRARRAPGQPFLAGAARLNITPPHLRRTWLAGFGFERRARGVLDPIWARAFFFDDGVQPLWLISADVVGWQLPSVKRIRALISPRWGENALVCATHNHDGPDTVGFWGPSFMFLLPVESGVDPVYLTWLERAVATCALRAVQTAVPATLRIGHTPLPEDLVINLRQPGHFDKDLTVLQAVAAGGRVIGTLADFPCHAESLADSNPYISADFPGFMYQTVERAVGGVCGFFQGAEGAMVTSPFDKHAPLAERYRFTQKLGRVLGQRVLQAAAAAKPLAGTAIAVRRTDVRYPISTDMFRLIHKLKLPLMERSLARGVLESEVDVAQLGALTMAAVPGEPSPDVGFRLRDLLKGEHRIVLALGNDEVGYLLTPAQFKDKRYEYEAGVSPGPEAGDLTLQAVRSLA
jgi:hypothetical protein